MYDSQSNYTGDDTLTLSVENLDNAQIGTATLPITVADSSGAVPDVTVDVPAPQLVPQATASPLTGLSFGDVDNETSDFKITLAVAHGTLTINTAVPGGITSGDITSGQGTDDLVVEATTSNIALAEINATLAAPNGLVYHSASGYTGPDLLTAIGLDVDNSTTAQAQLVLTVDDPLTVSNVGGFTVTAGSTLTNYASVLPGGGGSYKAILVQPPEHGQVTLTQYGTFTYTADTGYVGLDTFTFAATDGLTTSQPATVTIQDTSAGGTPVGVQASPGPTADNWTYAFSGFQGCIGNGADVGEGSDWGDCCMCKYMNCAQPVDECTCGLAALPNNPQQAVNKNIVDVYAFEGWGGTAKIPFLGTTVSPALLQQNFVQPIESAKNANKIGFDPSQVVFHVYAQDRYSKAEKDIVQNHAKNPNNKIVLLGYSCRWRRSHESRIRPAECATNCELSFYDRSCACRPRRVYTLCNSTWHTI